MENQLKTYIRNQVLIKPTTLSNDLKYGDKEFNHRSDFNNIIKYIDNFLEGNNINRFLLLPGLRDTGKTTLLLQIYEYLISQKYINPKNILFLSCDKLRLISNTSIIEAVNEYIGLYHDTLMETLSEPVFLLIDEAQYDENWSLTGKIIFDSTKNIFMIFTGSSALKLSYNADSARRLLNFQIMPLNYSQHLKLKYHSFDNSLSKSIEEIIFKGEIKNNNLQKQMLETYLSFKYFKPSEWKKFLQYGGFPSAIYQNTNETSKKIISMINKIITEDIKIIDDVNYASQNLAFNLLYFFAFQNPGEISVGSLANTFDSNKTTITKLLNILEKTQIIFNVGPFTSSTKRITKPKKYYFATSSLKHVLSLDIGNASFENTTAYMGKLFENFVASSFFNLDNRSDVKYSIYYDSKTGSKNVDFIVQKGLNNPIPIEVSCGKKNKSQIKSAIKRYKSSYGIIISNTKDNIVKEDNVIHIPAELFAFL